MSTLQRSHLDLCAASANSPVFNDGRFDGVLGAAAKILIQRKNLDAASILANARASVQWWDHDNWDGGQDTWKLFLAVPTDTYLELENWDAVAKAIDEAIAKPMRVLSRSDFINVEITSDIDPDPDWRVKTMQLLSGQGVTNQGRAHSNGVAVLEHAGLRFRSRPEIYFYDAMKSTGVAVAPLPVFVQGGIKFQRIEPDFVIVKQGITMVVEIDGDRFHDEKPAEAHARLKMLSDEGVIIERIKASVCDTPEKAREAAQNILRTLSKLRAAR